jgi:hypothetical protein
MWLMSRRGVAECATARYLAGLDGDEPGAFTLRQRIYPQRNWPATRRIREAHDSARKHTRRLVPLVGHFARHGASLRNVCRPCAYKRANGTNDSSAFGRKSSQGMSAVSENHAETRSWNRVGQTRKNRLGKALVRGLDWQAGWFGGNLDWLCGRKQHTTV